MPVETIASHAHERVGPCANISIVHEAAHGRSRLLRIVVSCQFSAAVVARSRSPCVACQRVGAGGSVYTISDSIAYVARKRLIPRPVGASKHRVIEFPSELIVLQSPTRLLCLLRCSQPARRSVSPAETACSERQQRAERNSQTKRAPHPRPPGCWPPFSTPSSPSPAGHPLLKAAGPPRLPGGAAGPPASCCRPSIPSLGRQPPGR
jgi:hypothetical protein